MQKEGSLHGNIPVLAVTANARPEQIATVRASPKQHPFGEDLLMTPSCSIQMLASGFNATISKPFKIPAIMDKIRKELVQVPRP